MSQVTIKATQSHMFAEGSIVTVERTDLIEKMIETGQVEVVDPSEAPPVEQSQAPAVNPELVVPSRNADTATWATFIASAIEATPTLFDGVVLTGDEKRNELIAIWDTAHPELNDVDSTGMPPQVPSNSGGPDASLIDPDAGN